MPDPIPPRTKPFPRWLRLLLMAILIAFACLAYYLTFHDAFEALE